jgi:uncharacterized protein YggU (UPF0235/DUF167 family)
VTRIAVRLTPRAARDGIDGWTRDARGELLLRIRVTAPPVDGRANHALVRVLAAALGIAPARVTLVEGAAFRRKLVDVELEPAEVDRRLPPR